MSWQESDIIGVAVSLCNYNEAAKAGVMYGILTDWRGKYIRYIGEGGVVYKTMRKAHFKRLPRKPQYVQEILQRANSPHYQKSLWK